MLDQFLPPIEHAGCWWEYRSRTFDPATLPTQSFGPYITSKDTHLFGGCSWQPRRAPKNPNEPRRTQKKPEKPRTAPGHIFYGFLVIDTEFYGLIRTPKVIIIFIILIIIITVIESVAAVV